MGSPKKVLFPSDDDELIVTVGTIPNRDDLSAEENDSLYFTKTDYSESRNSAKMISRESQRQGHGKDLDDTFSEKNTEAQDKLNIWAAKGHNRRGLERWANRSHGEKRQQEQFAAIQAVLEAQDEMLARDKQLDHDKLRKVSYKATKTSRHFARMMGKADSYALAHELKVEAGDDASQMSGQTENHNSCNASTHTEDDSISLPRVDELKGSHHDKGMFRRLKFRRQKLQKEPSASSRSKLVKTDESSLSRT